MRCAYYGVVGNRDHIKIDGVKRPFWEFLDRQPDGYLTSLVYMRDDLPSSHMIFDCGAWSYRGVDEPNLTPSDAVVAYRRAGKSGDFAIAPDHMLIPGTDLDKRRRFNKKSSEDFIKIVGGGLIPMATIHGMDTNERVENATFLYALGYRHFAVGGVAARASQKTSVIETVSAIRNAVPDVWLHVLGLSSPPYIAEWSKIGVQSCDGSSHFKQAFTGGAFFSVEKGKLKKWQAVRPGEEITAPECHCTACSKLMGQSVDTRQYGSNEHNMGRAAHNLNMLMEAQRVAIGGDTVLVSCAGKKANTAMPAKDIYRSDWFIKARCWAEHNGSRWYILSAKHGLLHPDTVIEPYEMTLNTMSINERTAWASMVHNQIVKTVPVSKLVFLAGQKYREHLWTLNGSGYAIDTPMEGLGIGQQLAWLSAQNQKQQELWK